MAHPQHLTRPPVQEALIDLRIAVEGGALMADIDKAIPGLVSLYPQHRLRQTVTGEVKMPAGGGLGASLTNFRQQAAGYLFVSADGLNIVQARPDGFTFSRLGQYTSWDDLYSQAQAAWRIYWDACGRPPIVRVATRFINRLALPVPVDFKEYLLTSPEVSSELPQGLSEYQMRLTSPLSACRVCIVTQTLQPRLETGPLPLILDIDVFEFRGASLPFGDPEAWATIAELRAEKNRFFFGSLTDRALEDFR